MQTTLLGLAVALILALVAALVGPHFVDWTRYRVEIEAQASSVMGAPVRVHGPIEVRLLPTPSLALFSVEMAAGEAEFSARTLRVELALGALMRGEWRVSELALGEPRLHLALDRAGALPALPLASASDPDRFAVERLVIEDGRAMLADAASGAALRLENLSFAGALRSLVGPLRGEGTFASGGTTYRYRISTGRRAENGVKLRLNLDIPERPLIAETDGTLAFDGASPRYEGTLVLAGPAGAVLAGGRAVAREPWKATAQVKVAPARAAIEQIEIQYGPEDRQLRLSGKADIVLGNEPRFTAALAGHQVDLDRMIGVTEAAVRLPALALPAILGAVLRDGWSPMPGKVELSFDALTLGGAALQTVRADAATDGRRWTIAELEFRAPGSTQVRLGGRLHGGGTGLEYEGPARIESGDPAALLSFIEGRAAGAHAPAGPLLLSGDLIIGAQQVTIDRLRAEIDRKPIEGRIAYALAGANSPARLDATLTATEIDLDGAVAIVGAMLGGTSLEWPRNVALALTVGKAAYAGIEAGRVDAKLKLDAGGLTIERLSVGDLRGASIKATGVIDTAAQSPEGSVSVAVAAAKAEGLASLIGRFAPYATGEVSRASAQLGPVDLRARLDVTPARAEPAGSNSAAPAAQARLVIEGKLGTMRINLAASGAGSLATPAAARVKLEGTVEAADGKVLAALAGLDRLVALEEARPGTLAVSANGPLDGDIACELRLSAGGLSATGAGTARLAKGDITGTSEVSLTAADARMLLDPDAPAALPLTVQSRVAIAGRTLAFEGIKGRIAGAAVNGRIGLRLGSPLAIDGQIETTDVDAGVVIAAVLGTQRRAVADPSGGSSGWSAEPFTHPMFAALQGSIAFAAVRAGLLPGLVANDLKGRAIFEGASLTLEEVKGKLADGTLTASAVFRIIPDGLSASARLNLSKAELGQISFGRGKPPATGTASLAAEVEGSGRSPAALVGALKGNGSLSVENAQIAGLDSKAIDAAIVAAERGLALDRLAGYIDTALDAGRLSIPAATTTIAIVDGQARVVPMIARPDGAEVALSATLNLARNSIDARFTLAGGARDELQGRRPEIAVTLSGPVGAPGRSVDTGALVGFITLQAVEREAKRLEAAEREAKRRDEAAARARAEQERAARQRAADERRARERSQEGAAGTERSTTGTLPGEAGASAAERAPTLPGPIEIKPQPAQPTRPAPRAKPAPPPPAHPPQQSRSFWDSLFGR